MESARPAPATFWQRWGLYLNELSATIVLVILAFITDSINPNNITPFIERDPTFSYALTVGMSLGVLIVISVIVPGVTITLCCLADYLFARFGMRKPSKGYIVSGRAHLYHYGFVLLGLVQALMATKLVTDIVKLWVRQPRPLAFALCNYVGYQEASNTGNFTAYWAATTPGVFGDVSKCQGSTSQIREAFLSFPSGHSSISFCGCLFLVYFLRAFFNVRKSNNFNWLAFIAVLPMGLAFWAAISRIRDKWHGTADVLAGVLIGIAGATLAWRNYCALERSLFPVIKEANYFSSSAATAHVSGKQSGDDELSKLKAGNDLAAVGGASPLLVTQRSTSNSLAATGGAVAPPL